MEKKNWELQEAFRQKARSLQDVTKKYNAMKSDRMKENVMEAASDDADRVLLNTVTGNRYSNRFDTRDAFASQFTGDLQGHRRLNSGSSAERRHQAVPAPLWGSQVPPLRSYTSRRYNRQIIS
jgi:hypothetical protein